MKKNNNENILRIHKGHIRYEVLQKYSDYELCLRKGDKMTIITAELPDHTCGFFVLVYTQSGEIKTCLNLEQYSDFITKAYLRKMDDEEP